jgi:aminoglycoside N3'-acetyltransferase
MLTPTTLARQLRALGVEEGALLMVHASLRRLGPVEGRADAVLDALRAAIGEQGTLLMVLGADPDEAFDALTTEVDVDDMGVLAEVFRTRPGTVVNDHAAGRMAAAGPLARTLLEDTPLHDYMGPGGVMQRFTDAGGKVLRLAADPDSTTITHWAEYLADIPDKRRVRARYVRADSGEQWIEGLDDTDGIVATRADDLFDDYFPQILLDFVAEGQATCGAVGGCVAELFETQTFVAYAATWLEVHYG